MIRSAAALKSSKIAALAEAVADYVYGDEAFAAERGESPQYIAPMREHLADTGHAVTLDQLGAHADATLCGMVALALS